MAGEASKVSILWGRLNGRTLDRFTPPLTPSAVPLASSRRQWNNTPDFPDCAPVRTLARYWYWLGESSTAEATAPGRLGSCCLGSQPGHLRVHFGRLSTRPRHQAMTPAQ
jgi:hypothetical protein